MHWIHVLYDNVLVCFQDHSQRHWFTFSSNVPFKHIYMSGYTNRFNRNTVCLKTCNTLLYRLYVPFKHIYMSGHTNRFNRNTECLKVNMQHIVIQAVCLIHCHCNLRFNYINPFQSRRAWSERLLTNMFFFGKQVKRWFQTLCRIRTMLTH